MRHDTIEKSVNLMMVLIVFAVSIGGLGIIEVGLVWLFVEFTGAEPEAVLMVAICQRLAWIFASIPGKGCVAEPGFVDVTPGRGVIII